ncbi:MAG: PQQ-binding-like beta-propeller repeat protein [Verrucomicrobia bacterium]|nr:PQQ-binding-like beta-propeller repeat protein [Verrucomicrobiota bacterium]
MWRHDARRSAATEENLPEQLSLRWVRPLPAAQPAWPSEPRLHFDTSNEPVVLGKLLFVGSALDGSVAAFDTGTGEQRWRFYTEGPVRFAPAAWRDRVFLGSDDGWLYCLDAGSGALRWKLRGAPDARPDCRHLGNGRLVSFWPVRGGPVVADGVVYFAAGIWPNLGVFVKACDADTGRVVWSNDTSHRLDNVRVDHNVLFESALSPQGYLAIAGDRLLVPNGRCLPAALDRRSGSVVWFRQGYRNGDCRVAVANRLAFVGGGGVINLEDGREVGNRWTEAGLAAPAAFDIKRFDLFESPIFAYKLFPGCDARSVFEGETAYGLSRGTFYAYDLSSASRTLYDSVAPGGGKMKPARWDLRLRWKLAAEPAATKAPVRCLIKAGRRLYGHADRTLLCAELSNGDAVPKIVWRQSLDATPSSMIAADGKLFVAAEDGRLFCFGEGLGSPVTHKRASATLAETDERSRQNVARILADTRASEGYAFVLGVGPSRVVEELLRQSQLRVIAVDADRTTIHRLRDQLVAADLYGRRAEVFLGDPATFDLPPYLANLVVSENKQLARDRIQRLLRPYGGVAWLDGEMSRREGALPGAAAWTHESADATRSFFSKDQAVKPPLGVLWYGDGLDYGFRKSKDYDTGVKPQVVGGRLFALDTGSNVLHAVDVFTGRLLWKTKAGRSARYASMPDGIYVAADGKCNVLDSATGQPRATFVFQEHDPLLVSDIRVADSVIVIAAAFANQPGIEKRLWDCHQLIALDRQSGQRLWTKHANGRFCRTALALGAGQVFCIDAPASRPPTAGAPATASLMALDKRTGQLRWQSTLTNSFSVFDNPISQRANDYSLACAESSRILLVAKAAQKCAFDVATGKQLWSKSIGGSAPMILRGDTFIAQDGQVYALATGERLSKTSLLSKSKGGCNYAVASESLLLLRDRSACYIELANGKRHYLRNVRSGCSNNLIAADGVLSVPCFATGCVCNYPIQTSFGLVHMPEVGEWDAK